MLVPVGAQAEDGDDERVWNWFAVELAEGFADELDRLGLVAQAEEGGTRGGLFLPAVEPGQLL